MLGRFFICFSLDLFEFFLFFDSLNSIEGVFDVIVVLFGDLFRV